MYSLVANSDVLRDLGRTGCGSPRRKIGGRNKLRREENLQLTKETSSAAS